MICLVESSVFVFDFSPPFSHETFPHHSQTLCPNPTAQIPISTKHQLSSHTFTTPHFQHNFHLIISVFWGKFWGFCNRKITNFRHLLFSCDVKCELSASDYFWKFPMTTVARFFSIGSQLALFPQRCFGG